MLLITAAVLSLTYCPLIEPRIAGAESTKPTYIAGGGRKAPGPDHGDDPNDEQHDPELPANKHKRDGYPSKDPYNGTTPNNIREPFTPY